MKIFLAKNYDDLSQKASDIIISQVQEKPNSVLGLATGSTPIGTYRAIISRFKEEKVSFSQVKTVNLDEYRNVEKTSEQSYYYFMNKNFFKHIDINLENTFIPNGTNSDAELECKKYETTIDKLSGIDLQLLGIGHNGHIGFNEPSDIFSRETHCVKLDKMTIDANARFFESISDVPKEAYTMGIKTIMSSKQILLLASGKDKADILFKTILGDITPQIPSTVLNLHHNVTVIADEDALSKILETNRDIIIK